MKVVLHIIKKDLRHGWPVFAAWLLLVAVLAWERSALLNVPILGAAETLGAPFEHGRSRFVALQAIGLGALLLVIIIVSAIFHDDPVPDDRAFWMTRPIARWQLFTAKLTTLTGIVIVPSLIAESLLMLRWGVSIGDLLHANGELLFVSAAALMLLVAAGALTRHGGHMLMVLAALVAVAMLALFQVGRDSTRWFFPWFWYLHDDWAATEDNHALVGLITWTVMLLGFGVPAWCYYRTRQRAIAVVITSSVFIALLFAWPVLTQALPMPKRPEASVPWATSQSTQARALVDERVVSSEKIYVQERRAHEIRRRLSAPVVLDGLPDSDVATPEIIRGEWQIDRRTTLSLVTPNESTFRSMQGDRYRPSLTPPIWYHHSATVGPFGSEQWPTLMTLSEAEFTQYEHRTGRYTGTVAFSVQHHEVIETRTLSPSVVYVAPSLRVEVVGYRDVDGVCEIDARVNMMRFDWNVRTPPAAGIRFQDAQGRLLEVVGRTRQDSGTSAPWLLPVSPSGVVPPFDVHRERVRVAPLGLATRRDERMQAVPAVPGTGIACANVRWSAIRVTDVGIVTRQLDIPDFVLDQP